MQDYVKRKKIFHYLRNLETDIILLQETHSDKTDEAFWKSQWGEFGWFASFSSNSRGVAILIRNSISVKVFSVFCDPNGRFLILNGKLNDVPVTLVNIYAPNKDDPDFLLEVFAEIDKFDNSSLIIGGDFNSVIGPLDYKGTRQTHCNSKTSEMLSIIIDEYDLVDVWRHYHPTLRQYTRHQKTPQVLSRLDYIFVSGNFLNNCVKSKILPGIQSDHSVVVIQFKDNQPLRGKGYWKLNCSYLHHDSDYINMVKDEIKKFKQIHQNSECNPNILWDCLKCVITGISTEYCSRKKKERMKEKVQLLNDIEKIRSCLNNNTSTIDSELVKLDELENKLNKIYDFETKGLMIRSRMRWLEEGEKCSKYFCNLENRAWQKKTINRVQNSQGNIVSDPNIILQEIQSFYSKLYSECDRDVQNENSNDTIFSNLDIPQLSEGEKHYLENPLSRNEIFDVIKSMKMNKSPGFDGFPIEFYMVFWPDICDMLMDSYNNSLQNGVLSMSQRNGVITLLPKKDRNPLFVKNYRPITLLTTDYKILAKCLAIRMKRFIHDLIHPDQSGFLKGRNIGNNVRLIFDIIEHTQMYDIPGAIILLDIEKAFDSVSHKFLFQTLKQFNFGSKFIGWLMTLYSERQTYVMNNGYLTKRISMQRGIFQGCPISPYLFLLVIEILALSIRQNEQVKGIKVKNNEVKISLFADDSVCFIDGTMNSFNSLMEILNNFGRCSGCKLNLTKTEAIWIGSKRLCQEFPLQNQGITWKSCTFKSLGVNFSLNLGLIFDLNYKEKLKRMTQTINCWRMRNLSLIGKICVIKSLVLPQLLYLFSVLSVKIPQKFFRELNSLFFKFIWSGGNDRVKRKFMCNDYAQCGLKMIDPYSFALSQKMAWVKCLLDDDFESVWKSIEILALEKFHRDASILWKSYAPETILSSLGNSQIADSLRTWYIYREQATVEHFNCKFSEIGGCQPLWFNRLIHSKSKKYFYYETWYEKDVSFVSHLVDPPLPGHKLFEDLILDFDIPQGDRRKFNFLMKHVPVEWLDDTPINNLHVHDVLVDKLITSRKVPCYAYKILNREQRPEKRYEYWKDNISIPLTSDWEKVHNANFMCTIDTRLRSFYFKIFHNTIALNVFLHRIKRKDSPNCSFCEEEEESIIHLFCDCDKVFPIWGHLFNVIKKNITSFNPTNFEKLFGVSSDKFVTYLMLITKYYIYLCRFKNTLPTINLFKKFVEKQKEIEYYVAKKRNKLPSHFKKWRFDVHV